jgi:hypothetical protein
VLRAGYGSSFFNQTFLCAESNIFHTISVYTDLVCQSPFSAREFVRDSDIPPPIVGL